MIKSSNCKSKNTLSILFSYHNILLIIVYQIKIKISKIIYLFKFYILYFHVYNDYYFIYLKSQNY